MCPVGGMVLLMHLCRTTPPTQEMKAATALAAMQAHGTAAMHGVSSTSSETISWGDAGTRLVAGCAQT